MPSDVSVFQSPKTGVKDWRYSSQLPDIGLPDEEWNDAWETLLQLPATSDESDHATSAQLQQRVSSQVRHPEDIDDRLSEHRSRLRELCYLQSELICEATDAIVLKNFESNWIECGEHIRREHLLKGLKQAASISEEFGHVRMYCDELTLPRLQRDNGRGFLEILIVLTYDDASAVPNQPNFLPIAAWDATVNQSADETQAQAIISAIRGKFIAYFVQFSMDSSLSLAARLIKRVKPEHTPASGARVMLEALSAINPNPSSPQSMICGNCQKSETDMGKDVKFVVCKVCKDRVNRGYTIAQQNVKRLIGKITTRGFAGRFRR